jgi:hypothetical protein
MAFTVVHADGMRGGSYRDYLQHLSRVLLKRGVSLDRVPVIRGSGGVRLYVWDCEADAQAFAAELREKTEDPEWKVQPADGQPSIGPLRPIEIELGGGVVSRTFGLEVFTGLTLRALFPGSCRYEGVTVDWDHLKYQAPAGEELRALAAQVLPILTGLRWEDLAPFESYQVINPVTGEILVGPTPIQPAGGTGGTAGPPSFPEDRTTGSRSQALR